ncbi:sigma-54 dependent transcriptional regulator [Maribacter sp. TH_r10]|uniref:sigma-54-dependent transcriptional regulator n=1 Tax=Maribacter sp. TH_r10 TaxID=3082086 RepID=UPI0029529AB8|nr:sigma-54 dependent transcriptional regulator [Maribacter sp. TH_r10]MDV7137951.1 sigma-54 dependent transcriptional regulator [Maribacter sp. TH_r10]
MPKILIIEDDTSFAQMLQKFLNRKGYEVEIGFTVKEGKLKLKQTDFDLLLTDLRLPDAEGIELISGLHKNIPVIIMTGYAEVSSAVNAMKKGAFDYISKPFTPDAVLTIINTALGPDTAVRPEQDKVTEPKRNQGNQSQSASISDHVELISPASKKLEEYIGLVAPTDMSVLITGESGTGKEVTAKSIHDRSKRCNHPFIAVDCGAIPKELASSEFFGHLKGSFTGAINDKTGTFEAANGGTLFLDEVGNLPYDNQIQLLRALQERRIRRIGSTSEIDVDVRILTATNEDLKVAVKEGKFREDLYHRLNEFSLQIPSLTDRQGDLAIFAEHFLKTSNERLNKQITGFTIEVWGVLETYAWPGNIRELQNVIQRAVLLTQEGEIAIEALPTEIIEPTFTKGGNADFSKSAFEKEQIIKALKRTNYNKSKAAKMLQVTRKTLYNRISQYGLDV